jgi:hypothetical protein
VRFVVKDAIGAQLEAGNIVLLSNLGFTAAGEVRASSACLAGVEATRPRLCGWAAGPAPA